MGARASEGKGKRGSSKYSRIGCSLLHPESAVDVNECTDSRRTCAGIMGAMYPIVCCANTTQTNDALAILLESIGWAIAYWQSVRAKFRWSSLTLQLETGW